MPASCKISSDFISATCAEGLQEIGGHRGQIYAFNYSEWIAATKTIDADGRITDVVLTTTGAKAWYYELIEGSGTITSAALAPVDAGVSGFTHSVTLFFNSKDDAMKNQFINKANYGRMVLVVVLDSSIVAQVYGAKCGLKLSEFLEDANDPAKGGGFTITLMTPTNLVENTAGVTFGTGLEADRVATIAKLEAARTAVV